MTDEHQDQDHDQDAAEAPPSTSAPTADYGAPWLPIAAPVDRS
ncbi:hypothetical protein [Streptomyces mutabilis]|nr:hypothetical protein [Streptomyces mutabilis]